MFTSATGHIFSFGLARQRHDPPFKPGGSAGAFRAPGVPSLICQNQGPGPRAGECGRSMQQQARKRSALRRRLPRRRPPCPCCKFTSSTAISQQLNNNCVPNSRRVPPRGPSSWSFTLVQSCQPVFEQRLSAGIRVTSHHGILHDFHHQATTSCTTHELSLF